MWRDPFDEIRSFEKKIRRMFDEFWMEHPLGKGKPASLGGELEPYREPFMDVVEGDKEVAITMELPGVNKEDIRITTSDDNVEISAERRNEAEREDVGYLLRERSYSRFYRKIPLTVPVDSSRAKASYKNGILEIVLPKTSESKRTIKID